jgi:hypothetical protein
MGVHRMLPCVDCHVGGNFTALSPNCAACHRKDAIRGDPQYVASPMGGNGNPATAGTHSMFPSCANCHNTIFFGPTMKATPGTRESVCR